MKKLTLCKTTPPNIRPPGTWKIAFNYKVKQSKNGKVNPIDFETQISLRR